MLQWLHDRAATANLAGRMRTACLSLTSHRVRFTHARRISAIQSRRLYIVQISVDQSFSSFRLLQL